MKSLSLPASFALAGLFAIHHVAAEPIPRPVAEPVPVPLQLKTMTPEGCYSSSTGLKFNSTYTYQTSGWCQPLCVGMNDAVLATTGGSDCWCGNQLPPASSKVDSSKCNVKCDGFGQEMCGGDGFFSVYLSGITDSVTNADSSDSPSSSSDSDSGATTSPTTSAKPSTVTVGGQTIVVTSTPTVTSKSSGGGTSKAGIAAGVVVGIVAVAGIAGGLFLYMRNKKRQELEEEHRKTAAINSIMSASKAPGSSGGSSFTDTRLDPTMAQRRMSDGSIADNQDYSRRILKVINA